MPCSTTLVAIVRANPSVGDAYCPFMSPSVISVFCNRFCVFCLAVFCVATMTATQLVEGSTGGRAMSGHFTSPSMPHVRPCAASHHTAKTPPSSTLWHIDREKCLFSAYVYYIDFMFLSIFPRLFLLGRVHLTSVHMTIDWKRDCNLFMEEHLALYSTESNLHLMAWTCGGTKTVVLHKMA